MYIQIYIIEIKSFPLVFAGTQYFRFTVQLSIFIALRGGNDITVVADVAFYLGVHKSDFKGHPIRDDEVDNADLPACNGDRHLFVTLATTDCNA